MYIFFILFALIIILDVKDLLKSKKELWFYITECIFTIFLSIFYYSNIYRKSFIESVLEMIERIKL